MHRLELKWDRCLSNGKYCYKMQGQIYYRISAFHPNDRARLKFAQFYILDLKEVLNKWTSDQIIYAKIIQIASILKHQLKRLWKYRYLKSSWKEMYWFWFTSTTTHRESTYGYVFGERCFVENIKILCKCDLWILD